MSSARQPITTLLIDLRNGRTGAEEELVAAVYQDLRQLAADQFRYEAAGHTLQPTAIVHELYVRLFGSEAAPWQDRGHFFAVAAQQIRHILVDHARARRAAKRGGGQVRVTMAQLDVIGRPKDEDVLALHEALEKLEVLDKRAAQVVELRFFGGLEEKESAEVLGISLATLKRDWVFARAWMLDQLRPPG